MCQFRFGTDTVTTELPAGIIEENEPPLEAAKRELREETGYTSERWTELGSVPTNPAIFSNRCWLFLAEDAEETHPPEPDAGEDIAVWRVPFLETWGMIQRGEIERRVAGAFRHTKATAKIQHARVRKPLGNLCQRIGDRLPARRLQDAAADMGMDPPDLRAAGGDQFLEVLNAIEPALTRLLAVMIKQAAQFDHMFEQLGQLVVVDLHTHAID